MQGNSGERRYFRLVHALLTSLNISDFSGILLKLIEFLQLSSIVMALGMAPAWRHHKIFQNIFKASTYTTFTFGLSSDFIILLLMLSILILTLASGIALSLTGTVKAIHSSSLSRVVVKVLAIMLVLLQTVLLFPFLLMCLKFLIGAPGLQRQWYTTLVGGLTLAFLIVVMGFVLSSMSDTNPFSDYVFSGEPVSKKAMGMAFKLVLAGYYTLDKEHKFAKATLGILSFINFLFILHHFLSRSPGFFRPKLSLFCHWLAYASFWLNIISLMSLTSHLDISYTIYFVLMVLLSFLLLSKLTDWRDQRTLTQNFLLMSSESEIEFHVITLIRLVDTLHLRRSRIIIEGYISYHIRMCGIPGFSCYCKEMPTRNGLSMQEKKMIYYEFMAELLKGSLPRIEDGKRIHRLISFIYEHRLKNRFQAIYEITRSLKNDSMGDRLEFQRAIQVIENEMVEYDIKQNVNLAVDMNKFLNFNVRIVEFEELLEQCANDHIEFWKEIMEPNINLIKVEKFGSLISSQKERVKEYFESLLEINSNNAHINTLYGEFLIRVCHEDCQNVRFLEKASVILKNIAESTQFNCKTDKYSDNAHTAIVIISGNEDELGKIVQTNNFIKESVGYQRRQLIGQNVSILMPKIFSDHHNNVLSRYLQTSNERMNGKERIVPVLCEDGFMFPATAYTKALPNLEQGIQIVGFISKVEVSLEDEEAESDISYILYDCSNEIVMGISSNCSRLYNIPKCLVYGDPHNNMNELKIKHLFGCSFEKEDSELTTIHEVQAEIDTRRLENEFIIINSESSKEMLDEGLRSTQRGVQRQVLVTSLLHLVYKGMPLRIISFYQSHARDEGSVISENKIDFAARQAREDARSESKSESSELKDLKEFKNFISVKREPKAIRCIDCMCLILLGLFALGFAGYAVQEERFLSYDLSILDATKKAFFNRMLTTEIMFNVEKLFINNNDKYSAVRGSFIDLEVQESLNGLVVDARHNEIKLLPYKNKLRIKKVYSSDFDVSPSGELSAQKVGVDEGITIWLSKIYNVMKNSHSYLSSDPLNFSSLTCQLYLETKYSQLFSLLAANRAVGKEIGEHQRKANDRYKVYVFVESGCLLLLAVIWLLITLPKTLEVTQINARVLSLFGLISPVEVNVIVRQCHIFKRRFLIEAETEDESGEEDDNKMEGIREFGLMGTSHLNNSNLNNSSLNASGVETSSRLIVGHKRKAYAQEREQEGLDGERASKLMNPSNKDKLIVWGVFLMIFTFLLGYIGFNTGFLVEGSQSTESNTRIIESMYERAASFQEIKVTFVEYLMEPELTVMGSSLRTINTEAIQRFYQNERVLLNQTSTNTYRATLSELDTEDICNRVAQFSHLSIWDRPPLTQLECQSINDAILTKGLKTTIVTALEQIRSRVLQSVGSLQSEGQSVLIEAIEEYEKLERYMQGPILMVTSRIQQDIRASYSKTRLVFLLANSIVIAVCLVVWKLGWKKYVKSLNENVWNTKGMLNIIPTKIITSNQILMNEFTSGHLQKAVL